LFDFGCQGAEPHAKLPNQNRLAGVKLARLLATLLDLLGDSLAHLEYLLSAFVRLAGRTGLGSHAC
jgi:hypothetical protein